MKIEYKKLFVAIALINILNINTVMSFSDTGKPGHKEGLDFRNNMGYKEITKELPQEHYTELENFMYKLEAMKKSGQWDLKGEELDSMYITPNRPIQQTTAFYAEGGLNSISTKYKATYRDVSPVEHRQTTDRGYNINKYYLDTPEYKQAIEDNLATQFDIRSPGSILTPEQWKNYIAKVTANRGYETFTINGRPQTMRVSDALAMVVDDIYRGSMEQFQKTGKTINPDFLVALSMHETGYGKNRHSKDKNSWFSMNATNVGSYENAYAYKSPRESVIDGIPRIYKFVDESDWRFNETKGPSILGANTTYAAVDGTLTPGVGWTIGITSIMRNAANHNGVTIPTF